MLKTFQIRAPEMSLESVVVKDDTVTFTYADHDSQEGQVIFTYHEIEECKADLSNPNLFYDVEITTGSDVWSTFDTVAAIQAAYELHRQHEAFERLQKNGCYA